MIGLDISDQTIKVVQLSNRKPRKLLAHCMKIIPSGVIQNGIIIDKQKMEEEIRATLVGCNVTSLSSDMVVASIPETQSFLRVIEIPQMSEEEVHEAVRWEIAQHIPFGLENVYVDWQPSTPSGHTTKEGYMEVEVGAAQRRVVDPLYEVMQKVGLNIVAYELESQAIVRTLISKEWERKQGILIIDLGSTTTNVIVYDYGAIRFTASLSYGVTHLLKDVAPDDAKKIMDNLSGIPKEIADKVQQTVSLSADAFVRDIVGIVKFYNGIDAKHEVKEIMLTGGGSNLPGLDGVFLKYFTDVHIQVGNPWVNVGSGNNASKFPLSLPESVRYSTAIGLALRTSFPL